MSYLAWDQSAPRSYPLFLMQYPSIILALEVPTSKRLTAAANIERGFWKSGHLDY
ncbi:MAG: hypothetical protein ACJAY2_002446 [Pseudomonadales bacterium]|jgi:hypothetical protein